MSNKKHTRSERITYELFSSDKEVVEFFIVVLSPFALSGLLYVLIEVLLFGVILK